jgi:hypothetical protein
MKSYKVTALALIRIFLIRIFSTPIPLFDRCCCCPCTCQCLTVGQVFQPAHVSCRLESGS